jgi:hypothetical protein
MVEVAMLKCVPILNVLLLAVGIDAFGHDQSLSSDVPRNSRDLGLHGYGRNDISCLEWSDTCVTCRYVTNQPQNTAGPTSELLANPRMFNVCDGAKSRQNPNSFTGISRAPWTSIVDMKHAGNTVASNPRDGENILSKKKAGVNSVPTAARKESKIIAVITRLFAAALLISLSQVALAQSPSASATAQQDQLLKPEQLDALVLPLRSIPTLCSPKSSWPRPIRSKLSRPAAA